MTIDTDATMRNRAYLYGFTKNNYTDWIFYRHLDGELITNKHIREYRGREKGIFQVVILIQSQFLGHPIRLDSHHYMGGAEIIG